MSKTKIRYSKRRYVERLLCARITTIVKDVEMNRLLYQVTLYNSGCMVFAEYENDCAVTDYYATHYTNKNKSLSVHNTHNQRGVILVVKRLGLDAPNLSSNPGKGEKNILPGI